MPSISLSLKLVAVLNAILILRSNALNAKAETRVISSFQSSLEQLATTITASLHFTKPVPRRPALLAPAEKELHILWRQLLHSDLIIIDSAVDHVRLLLLQHHHAALDGVFDA